MGKSKTVPTPSPAKGKSKEDTVVAVYPTIEAVLRLGDEAITSQEAKELLGWQEEPPGAKWGDDYLLTDSLGKKVRCAKNAHNRPFNLPWARQLCFDILNRHWADSRNGENWSINGESIIIGKSGRVLSAQHRLTGLVLASQEWEKQPHWKTYWKESPTLEGLIVYGVSEEGEVVRTLDNTRPRSLSDVLFTEESVFGKTKDSERIALTKILDVAIRDLWDRTGASNDSFSPYRSHAESLDFLQRHPRVLRAVKHVWDCHRGSDKKSQLLKFYCKLGTAAALLYLMGSSSTNLEKYEQADLHKRSDKQLDWSYWERAYTFWSDLARSRLPVVRQAIAALAGPEGDYLVQHSHKVAVLIKAWVHYRDGNKITLTRIAPEMTEADKGGKRTLLESLECGGIDLGSSADRRAAARAEEPAKEELTEPEEEVQESSQVEELPESPEEEVQDAQASDEQEEELEEEVQEDTPEEEEALEESNGEYLVDEEPTDDPQPEEESPPTDDNGPAPDDPSPEEIEEAAERARTAREMKKQQQRARLLADRDARKRK